MSTDPYTEDVTAAITQLQAQQSLFTQALVAMLKGKWTGAESVEALTYALDPNLTGTISDFDVPLTESDAETLPKG